MAPWLIAAAVLGLDQLSKHALVRWLAPGQSLPILPPVLHCSYVQNTGAAFGMLRGHPNLFAWLSVGVALWIGYELVRHPPKDPLVRVALPMIFGGAIGNLIDRVRVGYVIDFIDLRVWPVFNVADSAITIGVALLLWQTLKSRPHASASD